MPRIQQKSRRRERQRLMRELAAEEATVMVAQGSVTSRAVEAIDALARIRNGTYGLCVDCGCAIPATRLAVKPEATRCVTCQTNHERGSFDDRAGGPDYAVRRTG